MFGICVVATPSRPRHGDTQTGPSTPPTDKPKPALALGDAVRLQANKNANREYVGHMGWVIRIADDTVDVLLAGYPPAAGHGYCHWPLESLKPCAAQKPRNHYERAAKDAADRVAMSFEEGYQAGYAQALSAARVPTPVE